MVERTLLAEIVSDRWGDPLSDAPSPELVATVSRLAPAVADAGEMGFAAVDDDGTAGVLLEWEVPWSVSDDDHAVEMTWSRPVVEADAVTALLRAAAEAESRLAAAGLTARVAVLGDLPGHEDLVFNGRLALHVFVPEPHTGGVVEVGDVVQDCLGADLSVWLPANV